MADKEGFVLIAPDGVNESWNACCGGNKLAQWLEIYSTAAERVDGASEIALSVAPARLAKSEQLDDVPCLSPFRIRGAGNTLRRPFSCAAVIFSRMQGGGGRAP
jgi:hypothetical protein